MVRGVGGDGRWLRGGEGGWTGLDTFMILCTAIFDGSVPYQHGSPLWWRLVLRRTVLVVLVHALGAWIDLRASRWV